MIVSIIVLVKSGARTLLEALAAIFEQRLPGEFEVLAIDSCSHDDSLEILARHPVRVIQISPENFNHGLTRNLAAR